MSLKRFCLPVFVAFLFCVIPLHAGLVYVPVTSSQGLEANEANDAADGEGGQVLYETQIWVSNLLDEAHQAFSTRFIPLGADGTEMVEPDPPVGVAPGATVRVQISEGGPGLLELDLVAPLVVTARLLVIDNQAGLTSIAPLPVISSENLFAADSTAHLQSLERQPGGRFASVGIINLGPESAMCRATAFRSDASPIQQPAVLSFLPLSQRFFVDALNALGTDQIADARLEVSCDAPFFTYGLIAQGDVEDPTELRNLVFLTPSLGGDSDLGPPGDLPSPPGGGTVEVDMPGRFFDPVKGNSSLEIKLPLEPGVSYSRLTMEFDFFLNRWQNDLFHKTVGVNRAGGTLYFGIFLRSQNGGRTIVDIDEDDTIKAGTPWDTRTNYHTRIELDTTTGQLTIDTFRNGRSVHSVTGTVNHTDLRDNGNPVRIIFGQKGEAGKAFFPPLGWRFSNLEVKVFP